MRVMHLKVCISTANTLMYPQGGHLWVFINWALGLRSCGCDVTWLDVVPPTVQLDELAAKFDYLRATLQPFGLGTSLVVDFLTSEDMAGRLREASSPSLESLGPFDLLVDFRYNLPERLFSNFRRTALINIDPGQYELAVRGGVYPEPKHDVLFSIGRSPVQNGTNTHCLYTPPCVFLDEWPFILGSSDSPWTTVAHWWGQDPSKQDYDSKREGFRAFMTIPSKVRARFELALNVEHDEEQARIEAYGFKVHDAHKVVSTPLDYRSFIQNSAGEFSCAKPGYVKLQTAWLSDRTVCYLASGKPCVVQITGPRHFLPRDKGLHQFSDLSEAISAVSTIIENYETESRAARLLAKEFFDARKVCGSLLERAL